MIHRFVDVEQVRGVVPFISIAEHEISPGSFESYYQVFYVTRQPGGDPTWDNPDKRVSIIPGDALADCTASPDGLMVLYAFLNSSGANQIQAYSLENGWSGQIGSSQSSLLFSSQQPMWKPDGSGIVYRNIDDSPNETAIRTCDVDPNTGSTSNDQAILTLNRTTIGGVITRPTYSYDGSKIVYQIAMSSGTVDHELWVVNTDGTGNTRLAFTIRGNADSGLTHALANTANQVAYPKRITNTHFEYRAINLDGTGDTLLYDDTQAFFGFTPKAWAHDDSQLFFFKRISTTVDPQGQLWTIDPAGGGATAVDSGNSDLVAYFQNNDDLACVFGERVYFMNTDSFGTGIAHLVSCLYDGSDLRIEFDDSSPVAGLTSMSWVGGFFGFSNQPE